MYIHLDQVFGVLLVGGAWWCAFMAIQWVADRVQERRRGGAEPGSWRRGIGDWKF